MFSRKTCPYSGVLLNWKEDHPNQITLDRIDARKGYVVGNVIACAKFINCRKGNLNTDEIKAMYKVIKARKL